MKRKSQAIFCIFLAILISLVLITALAGCEPIITIKIENQTDQTLTVYINDRFFVVSEAGKPTENETVLWSSREKFTAKNDKGEIVFSKEFTPLELHDMHFTVVIK